MNLVLRNTLAPLVTAAFLGLLSPSSDGAGVSVINLHSFDSFLYGEAPYGALAQGSNGNFYGTTFQGGSASAGVIFEVASNGVANALYAFTNGLDGGFPEAGLVLANDGNFYGTTVEGGTNGTGSLFRITPDGGFTSLYSFSDLPKTGLNADGANPAGSLIQAGDGNLYGTASTGGSNGSGTLFKISLGGSFQLVYAFSALDLNGDNNDGADPEAALIQGTDDSLYGTASSGGASGLGAIFRYSLSRSNLSQLFSFTGNADGSQPFAALVEGSDGNFYGTTSQGGSNKFGAIFKITSAGSLTPLYSFADGPDGANPVAPLIQGTDGKLYGTSTGPQTGFGTIFDITTNGAFSPLYAFNGGNDGAYPLAGLVQASGDLIYGTTSAGGTNNAGAVFSITTNGAFAPVMSFVGGGDGNQPQAPLVEGTTGNFYGTTYQGGAAGVGVVFGLTPGGELTPLYAFTNGQDGAFPSAGLTLGPDGSFYGGTYAGGKNNSGVLFKITPQGTLSVLHSLTNSSEGNHPVGLVLGTNGDFYGTAYQGGAFQAGFSPYGTIFQMTPDGQVTRLYTFTNGLDGSYPKAPVTQGADGSLYGTTTMGGIIVPPTNTAPTYGTIFKITTAGALTALYSFTNGVDGATPQGQLVQGIDGNFYGTTTAGGAKGHGTIFRITPGGSFSPLYSFTNGIDGGAPDAGLAVGSGGNLFGTASTGGSFGMGTLFEITPTGAFTPLYSFAGSSDGQLPAAPLVLGTDGNFYGTASLGGASDGGTAFKMEVPMIVAPTFTSIVFGSAMITVTWTTVAGQSYQLQVASDLAPDNWGNLSTPKPGTGGLISFSDPTIGNSERYYRIITTSP